MEHLKHTKIKRKLLQKIGEVRDVMKGSLARTAVTCGKKTCRCQKGEKHPTVYFSYQFQKKQRVIHVPERKVSEVEKLLKKWEELKEIVERLTVENARIVIERDPPLDGQGKRKKKTK